MTTGVAVGTNAQNVSLTPLWVGMGAASIVVGIALQEPLANLFTGVSLQLNAGESSVIRHLKSSVY